MYRVCLRRDPDEGGFRYWVDKLNSGKKTGAEAVFNFYDSKEMKNSNLYNIHYQMNPEHPGKTAHDYAAVLQRKVDVGEY